jgi:hypothetical protein
MGPRSKAESPTHPALVRIVAILSRYDWKRGAGPYTRELMASPMAEVLTFVVPAAPE